MNETTIQVTAVNAHEDKVHTWVTEASQLGLRPGHVPQILRTELGNGQPFVLVHAGSDRFLYRQSLGCLGLVVFND